MKNIFDRNSIQIKILIAVAAIAALFVLYGVWAESQSGSIEVFIAERGATVFLDQKRAGIANNDRQTITLKRVSPGSHSVLVHLEGYYPWEKTIDVATGGTTEVRSFFIRTEILPSYKKTEFTGEEQKNVERLFTAADASRQTSFSGEGNVALEKSGGRIAAQWLGDVGKLPSFFCGDNGCASAVEVLNSATGTIGAMTFFPGREDVVLFTLGPSIYALELDKRGTQNFQPIYAGTDPDFATEEETSMLYTQDNGVLFGIKL